MIFLLVPVVQAGAGHLLADAAIFDEVFFEAADLLVEEVVGLVDEVESNVGEDGGGAVFEKGTVGFEGLLRGFAEFAHVEGLGGVFGPDGEVPDTEEVLVVNEQFLQAGAGDVGEGEFGFGGGFGGLGSFGDVLFSGAGGLDHLVNGAVAPAEKLLAKAEGEVVDNFGFPVREQLAVVASFGEEAGSGWRVLGWHGGGGSWE